jgi:hypothetical protein
MTASYLGDALGELLDATVGPRWRAANASVSRPEI